MEACLRTLMEFWQLALGAVVTPIMGHLAIRQVAPAPLHKIRIGVAANK